MADRVKVECACGQHVANAQMKQHVTGNRHRAFVEGVAPLAMGSPSAMIAAARESVQAGAYMPPDGREASTYDPPRLDGAAAALDAAVQTRPGLAAVNAPADAHLPASNPRTHAQAIYEADKAAHPGEHAYGHLRAGVDASATFMPNVKDGQPQMDLVTGNARTTVPPLVAGVRDDADPEREEPDSRIIEHTGDPQQQQARESAIVDALGSGPLGKDYNMFADRPIAPTVRAMQEGARPAGSSAPAGVHRAPVMVDDTRPPRTDVVLPPTDGVTDDYSQALGAARYNTPYVFDDPEERLRDFRGHRLKFSRFYFDQGVLFDIFAYDTAEIRTEIAGKSRAIATWNLDSPDQRMGYIPIMLGVALDFEAAVMALRGKVMPFQIRQPYQ